MSIRTVIWVILLLAVVTLFWLYGRLILIAVFWLFLGFLMGGGFSGDFFPSSQITERGHYYRITAQFLVDQVEPLEFDLVVACGRMRIKTKGSEKGQTPTIYGRRTKNNHAVLLAVPKLCGTAGNRKIGQKGGVFDGSFLPFVIWFDDASQLNSGVGYSSIRAYENPSARLSFLGATVRYATREEFQNWYENSNDNLVSKEMISSGANGTYDFIPDRCFGIGFAAVNSAGSQVLNKYWPPDQPDFWSPGQFDLEKHRDFIKDLHELDSVTYTVSGVDRGEKARTRKEIDWYYGGHFERYSSLNKSKLSDYLMFQYFPTKHYPVYYKDAELELTEEYGVQLIVDVILDKKQEGYVACYNYRGKKEIKSGVVNAMIRLPSGYVSEVDLHPLRSNLLIHKDNNVGEFEEFFSLQRESIQ